MGSIKNLEPKKDTKKKKASEKTEEEKELYKKYQKYLKSDKFKEIRKIVFEGERRFKNFVITSLLNLL